MCTRYLYKEGGGDVDANRTVKDTTNTSINTSINTNKRIPVSSPPPRLLPIRAGDVVGAIDNHVDFPIYIDHRRYHTSVVVTARPRS